MPPEESAKPKLRPRPAFMPASDPGYYWRQRMEAAEDRDVEITFDFKKQCLVIKHRKT